ncbi:MAG: phosphate ABC transporter substrate-binding protein PstS [Bacteroidota bacterium]|nr:phosphate ABC transporter substrate-binding protein PstS [Bacteroidota bacterium]MDP4233108.1 phosphate ABC transporter substrate-binding protein PstS [Bacteroidota bacterium]MDP4241747.1 phosphate ABC transporter substrate-binding protein PstS [Bacteroidota bacterium]MDP4287405.1 phosphate ABC transporter substrate-binding protein PstS [Bacteroidota bacterium]
MLRRVSAFLTIAIAAVSLASGLLTSCGGGKSNNPDSTATATTGLTGAGSTFINPIMTHWAEEYPKDGGVSINYQSVGSGAGINNLIDHTVDFAGSDAPMNADELARAKAPVIHVPAVIGAVCVSYNVAGITSGLKLTPQAIADIFLGKTQYWDDKSIASVNPGMKLPHEKIFTAHRSDGSGTTAIFTDYLAKISPEWKTKIGSGKTVTWPEGTLGGKGNAGVAQILQQHANSIGYIELAYAEQNKIPYASVQNSAGNFIVPSADAAAAAAEAFPMPDNMTAMITNTSAAQGYPITGFSWIITYKDSPKADAVKKFIAWSTTKGQADCKALYYAPIPQSAAAAVAAELK